MKYKLDGQTVSYSRTGKGKVVVLLHGWGVDKDNMTMLHDYLDGYDVIALDLPGFGDTEIRSEDASVRDYAEFVEQFLESRGASDAYAVIGHSFGGRVAIKLCGELGFPVKKLVLIGSAGISHTYSARNKAYMLLAKIGKAIFALPLLRHQYYKARQKLYSYADSSDYLAAGNMRQIFLNSINEDLSQAASNIHVPTLLVWGSEDDQTPIGDARIFHELIPNTSLKIIQGAGHFVHNEHPKKVGIWIKQFLS